MKHWVATLGVLVGLAVAAGFVAFRVTADDDVARALAKQDAMAWLRADFDLTDEQFAAIKRLHDAYSTVCEEHCRDIQRAVGARNELRAAKAEATVLAAAERRVEELRTVCETAIAAHVRACAAHMSPEAGRRYLALTLPKIKDFDHAAAPDVQLNRPAGHTH